MFSGQYPHKQMASTIAPKFLGALRVPIQGRATKFLLGKFLQGLPTPSGLDGNISSQKFCCMNAEFLFCLCVIDLFAMTYSLVVLTSLFVLTLLQVTLGFQWRTFRTLDSAGELSLSCARLLAG